MHTDLSTRVPSRCCFVPRTPFLRVSAPLMITLVAGISATATADVVGFNNLSGWMYNQSDTGAMASLPNADTIHITNLGTNQARSIFFGEPQSVAPFLATFTYRAMNTSGTNNLGATFTLHNDPRGIEALGGSAGAFGFGGGSNVRIENSAAVSFSLRQNTSGFFTGGVIGGGAPSVDPIDLDSGNPIEVVLEYDGFFLTETLTDTVTLDEYVGPAVVVGDLASIVDGSTAYVGFTASTSNNGSADQFISDFRFTTIPEPATVALLSILGLCGRRIRRR